MHILAGVMASNKKPKVDLTDDERPGLPTPDQGLFDALAASQSELEKASTTWCLLKPASTRLQTSAFLLLPHLSLSQQPLCPCTSPLVVKHCSIQAAFP